MTGRHFSSWICDDLESEPPGGWDSPELHEKLRKSYETMAKQIGDADPGIRAAQREFNRMGDVVYLKRSLIGHFGQEEPMRTINVYKIIAVYGENPDSLVIFRPKLEYSYGRDEEEAILRSGIHMVLAAAHKEPTTEPLDPRYITIICSVVGAAKVAPPQS